MSLFLRKKFDSSKCKTLLQLTSQRLKVLRNKEALNVKKARADVAKLLEKGQDSNAKMQVEAVFREQNIVALYELLDQFCQILINRLESIKSQKECPFDLKEAVASLVFAAPRCAELVELQKISKQLTSKYGTEFSVAAKELRPDCGVNKQIVQSLSTRSPDLDERLKLLKEIAVESNINWEYETASADNQLGADLLDGPNHFASATELSEVSTSAVPENSRSMHMNEGKRQHQISTTAPNQKEMGVDCSSRAQKLPDGVINPPMLDPYALARSQGKMDYKVVSDYVGRPQSSAGHLKSVELRQESRHRFPYGESATQLAEQERGYHNAISEASNCEDAPQNMKEKKSKKRRDTMELNRRNEQDELLELTDVAECAFVAATQAAEAAKAAVDLVRMESLERSRGSKVVHTSKLQEMNSESSFGPVNDENHKLDMYRKHSADRDKIFCENEVEMESNKNSVMVGDQGSHMNRYSTADASEDSFKYVVFEQSSAAQKYTQRSTQAEENIMNAESYAFPTPYAHKDPDRRIFDEEHDGLGSEDVPTNANFDGLYGDIMKGQESHKKTSSSISQERVFQQDKHVQNDLPVPQFDDSGGEEDHYLQKETQVPQFEDSSSEDDDYMQKGTSVPQFDDHVSEEEGENEVPFYLRGRAAMGTKDYDGRCARNLHSNIKMLASVTSFSNDDDVEDDSNVKMWDAETEANLQLEYVKPLQVSNAKGKPLITEKRTAHYNLEEPPPLQQSFDDYVEPVSVPNQSSKTHRRLQITTDSTTESSSKSPVPYTDSSGKPITPQKLKWRPPVNEEWDLDSNYGKIDSPLTSTKLLSLNGNGSPSNQVNRKLTWFSGASEDSESMSERSFESHKQRLNPSSLEDLNLESPKCPSNTRDFTRSSTADPTHVTQPSPRKSFVGVSKRSVRSTRSRQS